MLQPVDTEYETNLPDEIIARIVCSNRIFHGLILSKNINKESLKYAIPLSLIAYPTKNEYEALNLDNNMFIQCWDNNDVDISVIEGRYTIKYYRCKHNHIDDSFNIIHMKKNKAFSSCSYNIAPNQIKILNRRLNILGVTTKSSHIRDYYHKLRLKLTDFQYAIYLLFGVKHLILMGKFYIKDVINKYETLVKRMFEIED